MSAVGDVTNQYKVSLAPSSYAPIHLAPVNIAPL